jgi:sirohydrochlorin cobaltochelatase
VSSLRHLAESSAPPLKQAFRPGDGVLLIGHGTRDAQGTQQFFSLGERLKECLQPIPVEPCLLELQPPTIAQGWQSLMERGVRRVLVSPLLLFSAGHAKSDIPQALNECAKHDREVRWLEARPLSRSPELLSLVLRRLDASLQKVQSSLDQTAIVMVGRGSYDPCAQADMKLLTHWVGGQRSVSTVVTSFYAMAEPKLPNVLRQVASRPTVRSIIVQPHLLFEGALYQSIIQQTHEAANAFPDKQFVISDYLGPEQEVAEAIVRRLTQQLA